MAVVSSDGDIVSSNEPFSQQSLDDWSTVIKIKTLVLASYLNEPFCKVREYFYTFYTLNRTCKTSMEKVIQAVLLTLGIVVSVSLIPLFTPVGLTLRAIPSNFSSKPFLYQKRNMKGKTLPSNKKITVVSHNQCYIPGAYSVTDGGVTPCSDKKRMDANIKLVKELNPDVICLYEVADICDANYISFQLQEYPFIIPVSGLKAMGASSMMYVASKYEIVEDSIEFVPFSKGIELTGRAQGSEKGYLSFDIKSHGEEKPFANIVSTHLQHSEIPGKPEEMEVTSRALQMAKIARHIQRKAKENYNVIFTGDLNQEEEEMKAFIRKNSINWRRDGSIQGKPTWQGDKWCAELMQKPASDPIVLDYLFIAGRSKSVETKIIGTGYSAEEFRAEAGSDHDLLFSTVLLDR